MTVEEIDKWDGTDHDEAIRIADASFGFVMGKDVERVLKSMSITMGFVEAHYVWGYDAGDLGHVFDMKANLWTGTIIVTHCR